MTGWLYAFGKVVGVYCAVLVLIAVANLRTRGRGR